MTLRPALSDHATTAAMATLAVLAFLLSLWVGPQRFGLPAATDAARLVFFEIRLPRAILGCLVGAALGTSGAVLQGYLRNPLAEPGLIGISGGASLGAVVAIHSGLAAHVALALPLGGLIGAALATLAMVGLAGARSSPTTLILAGVAVSSIAAALTSLALNLSPNPFASVEMVYWLMGSLTDRSLIHVWLAAPLILVGLAMLLSTARDLEALTLGEDAAENLGVDAAGLRFKVIAGTALAVGGATAVTGAIGFVGLIVPHLIRGIVGPDYRLLLPASVFGGGAFLIICDTVARTVLAPVEIPVGVITALMGGPFFVWLLWKR